MTWAWLQGGFRSGVGGLRVGWGSGGGAGWVWPTQKRAREKKKCYHKVICISIYLSYSNWLGLGVYLSQSSATQITATTARWATGSISATNIYTQPAADKGLLSEMSCIFRIYIYISFSPHQISLALLLRAGAGPVMN